MTLEPPFGTIGKEIHNKYSPHNDAAGGYLFLFWENIRNVLNLYASESYKSSIGGERLC